MTRKNYALAILLLISGCQSGSSVVDRGNGYFNISADAGSTEAAELSILKKSAKTALDHGKKRFAVIEVRNSSFSSGGSRYYASSATIRLLNDQDVNPQNVKIFVATAEGAHPE